MVTQQKSVHKKLGRPTGRQYVETIPVRLTPAAVKAIDHWASRNNVSRSDAIRQLVELGLKASGELGLKASGKK
jgi:hypothetical protein